MVEIGQARLVKWPAEGAGKGQPSNLRRQARVRCRGCRGILLSAWETANQGGTAEAISPLTNKAFVGAFLLPRHPNLARTCTVPPAKEGGRHGTTYGYPEPGRGARARGGRVVAARAHLVRDSL